MNCRGHTYRIKILTDVKYFITNSLNIKGKKKKKKNIKGIQGNNSCSYKEHAYTFI